MKFIGIDLQNDFASEGGYAWRERESVSFIKNTLLPFFDNKGIKTLEIVSDYRLPSKKAKSAKCVPGTRGYDSILPIGIKNSDVWIKSMHSPLRVRDNRGTSGEISYAYQDTKLFDARLKKNLGNEKEIILYGLTLDCCILATAQELSWRCYKVFILKEGTDVFDGDHEKKDGFLENIWFWVKAIPFKELENY